MTQTEKNELMQSVASKNKFTDGTGTLSGLSNFASNLMGPFWAWSVYLRNIPAWGGVSFRKFLYWFVHVFTIVVVLIMYTLQLFLENTKTDAPPQNIYYTILNYVTLSVHATAYPVHKYIPIKQTYRCAYNTHIHESCTHTTNSFANLWELYIQYSTTVSVLCVTYSSLVIRTFLLFFLPSLLSPVHLNYR